MEFFFECRKIKKLTYMSTLTNSTFNSTNNSDVYIIPASAVGFAIAGCIFCAICSYFCCLKTSDNKRKIHYMMEEARLEYLMEKEVPDTGAIELLQVDDDD